MSESLDFNPALPESRQFTPPAEGGNGNIHKPGDYHNLIWQTRSRVPENWELQLIATLETLFEQGAENLGELVSGLNGVRMHDQQGEPWSESSFQAFYRLTATEDTAMTTTVQNYLDKGLRGLWYPVLASWEVQSAPVGITRLGEQIVVWRNKDGQVQALEDRCPHRGARLSMGWNLGDRIACWYHGVEVAGNGEVKDVPAVDRCPLVGQQCVRSYSVHEAHGAIFLWFGVTADQQPDELSFPEELADSEKYSNFLCTAAWKCNYQYALENVMDPMHGTYLHSSSHSMAEGDRKADMVLQPTKTGFIFEKKGRAALTLTGLNWATAAPTGCVCLFRTKSVSGRAATSGSSAWWFRKITITVASSSGASAAFRAGSAICGALCTATVWKSCTGKYWSRIAWCWKAWRRTPAIMNTFINMTSVCPACAA